MAGTVLTNKGLSLITKLVAAKATLSFSRVAVGTGSVPSGTDPQNMIGLNAYKMDAAIESYGVSPEQTDVAFVVAQISSVEVQAGFAITEAGIFATDPDEGEILYAYLDLTDDPQYIYASTDAISKFAEITFNVLIGSVSSVTAIISPRVLVTRDEFDEELAKKVDSDGGSISDTESAVEEPTSAADKYPEIQASSGTTKTIFGLLARWVKSLKEDKVDASGGDIKDTKVSEFTASTTQWPVPAAGEAPKTLWGKVKKFCEDFKTWSAGVCLLAQLVSNTTTNNANLPASAAAVYQLAQAMLGYAPKAHASSATTYGAGNASNFGHVKLSDNYTSSAGAAANGVAASSKALADAYSVLNTKTQKNNNQDIKSGTILEWYLAHKNENIDTFCASEYYPEDIPEQMEGYVEFKRGTNGSRTIVFFYPYHSSADYYYQRDIFNGSWHSEWKKRSTLVN